jgi:hypothetical protein
MSKPSEIAAEGRAKLARPSLRLLPVVLLASALLAVPAAQAAPPTPILTGTSPKSPNVDLSPFVRGNSSGVIIASIRPPRLNAVRSSLEEPTIDLYTEAECKGPVAGHGTANDLDTTGIQVTVEPETTTSFYAKQTDGSGESGCSLPISYQHVKELPPEEPPPGKEEGPGNPPPGPEVPSVGGGSTPPLAPRLRTVPSGRANDNSPQIIGSAPGADAVRLFTNSSCSGSPAARVSPGELVAGVELRVPDNSVTDFAGISIANGKQSFCSPPATYIEDSTPPHVRITMGPGAKTRRHKAVFRFADTSGDPAGAQFKCKVDHGKWKTCHSPLKLRHLGFHRYTLRVRGTDTIGNAEAKPAKRSFKVVR